ncbi:unnamed protein product [Arabidopsis thaliana]|uniref:(thale cress) hypothetical protein n=1 Tax=Arabidopsis thaliana TaxID=3702 RepID=A0A7G2EQY6_ARATH|nr:unnamed protein product [Arabidopsis thaliana]
MVILDMKKKQKLDDSVDDEALEEEKRRYRSMAKVAIGYGINPSDDNSVIPEMIHTVCPDFSLDTSKLKSAILEMHEEGKEKVKKMLKDGEGKLTLCYEWFWTSDDIDEPILNEDFIGISAYFADENWKMKKWILGYHPRASLCLKDIYVDSIKNVILDYEMESKVSTLLMPNYGDLGVKAFDDFRKWIEEKGKNLIGSRVFLIYCCSDIFRLMVDDMFKDINIWLMGRVRLLVGWGRMVPTNWDVTLYNLQKAVDMEATNVFEEEEDYQDYEQPSDEEWIKIKTFCKLAGCIYKVAKELFDGDKAKEIVKRFDKYWNDMFLVMATASVLDPRFKLNYLQFYCSKNEDFVLFQEFLKYEGSSREFHESELDSYLKEPVMEWKKDFNALEWWREENSKYPILSGVARDILSIPITRGTSHHAYVADKRECPDFIVYMEAKLVNAMMCSESWPRF